MFYSLYPISISIHTALAGCDIISCKGIAIDTLISIHTALAGCDVGVLSHYIRMIISIHTALAGCDIIRSSAKYVFIISIHTALAGCDRTEPGRERHCTDFNPHSPRRL